MLLRSSASLAWIFGGKPDPVCHSPAFYKDSCSPFLSLHFFHTILEEGVVKEDSLACVSLWFTSVAAKVHLCGSRLSLCANSRASGSSSIFFFFFRLLLGVIDVMIINHLLWLICVVLQWSHRMSCDIRRRSGTRTWSSCETIPKHIILIRLFVVYLTFKTDFLKDFFVVFWDKNVSAKGREWFCVCAVRSGCVGWSVPWHHRISVVCQDETSGGGFGRFLFSFFIFFFLLISYIVPVFTSLFFMPVIPNTFSYLALCLQPKYSALASRYSWSFVRSSACLKGGAGQTPGWGGVATHLGEPLERLLCPLWHQQGLIPTAVCVLAHTFRKVEQAAKVKERRFSFPDSLKRGWNLKFH